jgi:hypothetical protein
MKNEGTGKAQAVNHVHGSTDTVYEFDHRGQRLTGSCKCARATHFIGHHFVTGTHLPYPYYMHPLLA